MNQLEENHPHWERTLRELERHPQIPGEGKLLEFGCGTGERSLELAARGFEVTGLEPSHAAVEKAKTRTSKSRLRPTFLQGDETSLSRFQDQSFDIVFDSNHFHRIPPSARSLFLTQVFRVLTPWGALYLSTVGAPEQVADEVLSAGFEWIEFNSQALLAFKL